RMALVSGRPISFQMDLYTPLYVPRPTVVPELFASLRPVTYNSDLNGDRFGVVANGPVGLPTAKTGAPQADAEQKFRSVLSSTASTPEVQLQQLKEDLNKRMDLAGTGVSTMA